MCVAKDTRNTWKRGRWSDTLEWSHWIVFVSKSNFCYHLDNISYYYN
jgi:hypothetical protein